MRVEQAWPHCNSGACKRPLFHHHSRYRLVDHFQMEMDTSHHQSQCPTRGGNSNHLGENVSLSDKGLFAEAYELEHITQCAFHWKLSWHGCPTWHTTLWMRNLSLLSFGSVFPSVCVFPFVPSFVSSCLSFCLHIPNFFRFVTYCDCSFCGFYFVLSWCSDVSICVLFLRLHLSIPCVVSSCRKALCCYALSFIQMTFNRYPHIIYETILLVAEHSLSHLSIF